MNKLFLVILATYPIYASTAYYVRPPYVEFNSSLNSVGHTGLIHIPSAEIQDEGSVTATVGNSSLNKFVSIVATPFSWFEASFYYHRPRDSFYIKQGNYLDKGFNIKISQKYNNFYLAVGLDDIGGTGFFRKEYMVATYNNYSYKVTLGVGTGEMSGHHPYQNPIKNLRSRPNPFYFGDEGGGGVGGELALNTFFRGPIGFFGGIEYSISKFPGLTLKLESNPYNYQSFLAGGNKIYKTTRSRKKNKNYNFGLNYNFFDGYSISLAQVKGNGFDLKFSKRFNFNSKRPSVQPKSVNLVSMAKNTKLAFYQNLLRNLEKDKLYLQSAELNSSDLKVAIVNNKYNNPIDVFDHTNMVVRELSKQQGLEIKNLTVSNVYSGIEMGKMSARTKNLLNPAIRGKGKFSQSLDDYKENEFQTNFNFPELYYKIKPGFIYRYADPARFFAGGLDAQIESEVKFSPNTFLTSTVSYQVWNSFERSRDFPDSPYLPHVRTDYVKYVNQRPDLYLNTVQLHSIFKVSDSQYVKFSGGMYEMMFGGIGAEYYWKPFDTNLSIGLNLFKVKQRDFKQLFNFNDYQTETGHANILYFHSKSKVLVNLSVGKYLAGDKGYTLDLSRKFKSGLSIGAYFTRTNISKSTYGEGSFDKGFYFKVPFTFFSKDNNSGFTNILIQPLTRDGGAKLKIANPLIDSIFGGSKYEYTFSD